MSFRTLAVISGTALGAFFLLRANRSEDGVPKRPDAPPALAVRVASYNIWAVPVVSAKREERLAQLPGALRGLAPDVVCLQEAWGAADRKHLRDALADILPHTAEGGGGLMILSRFSVAASSFVKFPLYDGLTFVESLAGKGLLDATLDTPQGPLRVVTTHLAAEFRPAGPRSRQQDFLLEHLASLREHPLILAGDLNASATKGGGLSSAYRLLLDSGLTDIAPPLPMPDGGWALRTEPTRVGWPRPTGDEVSGWRPDYVFFRSSAHAQLSLRSERLALADRENALSDHNLLLADLRLQGRSSAEDAAAGEDR